MYYIKTVSLNEQILTLNVQIKTLSEENRTLYLELLSKTTLEEVEAIATERLHMARPEKIIYMEKMP
jgi:cell division protein FtsL